MKKIKSKSSVKAAKELTAINSEITKKLEKGVINKILGNKPRITLIRFINNQKEIFSADLNINSDNIESIGIYNSGNNIFINENTKITIIDLISSMDIRMEFTKIINRNEKNVYTLNTSISDISKENISIVSIVPDSESSDSLPLLFVYDKYEKYSQLEITDIIDNIYDIILSNDGNFNEECYPNILDSRDVKGELKTIKFESKSQPIFIGHPESNINSLERIITNEKINLNKDKLVSSYINNMGFSYKYTKNESKTLFNDFLIDFKSIDSALHHLEISDIINNTKDLYASNDDNILSSDTYNYCQYPLSSEIRTLEFVNGSLYPFAKINIGNGINLRKIINNTTGEISEIKYDNIVIKYDNKNGKINFYTYNQDFSILISESVFEQGLVITKFFNINTSSYDWRIWFKSNGSFRAESYNQEFNYAIEVTKTNFGWTYKDPFTSFSIVNNEVKNFNSILYDIDCFYIRDMYGIPHKYIPNKLGLLYVI